MNSELIKKYNVAAPRYTSYPAVPYWDTDNGSQEKWPNSLKKSFIESFSDGISIYIHLPFCESLCTYCGCNTNIKKLELYLQKINNGEFPIVKGHILTQNDLKWRMEICYCI